MSARHFLVAVWAILVAFFHAFGREDRAKKPIATAPGRYTLRFGERHPLSGPREVSRRTGIDYAAQPALHRKDAAAEVT